ncbi:hypothetical protein M1M25_gp048 [Tenacibaculum phage Gundel_1]|uniref:Uncharacterized protein n=1 Tax=Tenacibaculum phage Gundel_1 TaxID=2745672 RepID=A0A8E5EBL3_9CAUD|nr:hypothetical protein M1M25_gp048 [Tenacibaculum phage Gundel_1]QQV91481.1 hypothetical protein Gundel1_48 [Tenacibaculum phage Gundel_1]
MTKLSLKELHEIEVIHSVVSFCTCVDDTNVVNRNKTCSKYGLEIIKPDTLKKKQ